MFGFLKKKESEVSQIELPPLETDGEKEIICVPMKGMAVPCEEIKDLWDSHWLTNMGVKHQQLQAAALQFHKALCDIAVDGNKVSTC